MLNVTFFPCCDVLNQQRDSATLMRSVTSEDELCSAFDCHNCPSVCFRFRLCSALSCLSNTQRTTLNQRSGASVHILTLTETPCNTAAERVTSLEMNSRAYSHPDLI
ncbi:hypothetical protein SRHO_G00256360 [Serrasalmus rhombeus]